MWFNNIVVYQFQIPFDKNAETIQEAMEEHHLKPCPAHARQSQGWINPVAESNQKIHSIFGCHVAVAAKDMRLLPASIIQAVLEEKMSAFELSQNRPMRRAESLQLKEEIEFELLPKAFTVQKKDWLYIDTVNQWVVINGANLNKASEVMTLLTKTLGSMDAVLLASDADLGDLFGRWLRDPSLLPIGLSLQKNCILINSKDDKSQYNCKDIEQNMDDIIALLNQGYCVSSLEFAWEDRVQFTLTNNFMLKRLKCMEYVDDTFKDNSKLDSEQEKFDANFSLLVGEVRGLITFLLSACKKPEAAILTEREPMACSV